MWGPTYRKLPDNDRHNLENFGISRGRYITIVIDKNSVEKCRHNVGSNHFKIISFLNVSLDKLENFLLDGTKSPDLWCLGRDISYY
jgi:hypothetical protein